LLGGSLAKISPAKYLEERLILDPTASKKTKIALENCIDLFSSIYRLF
jgi:hypothetical protein